MASGIAELARSVRHGEVTARALAERALAMAEEKAALNAFIRLDRPGALAQADRVDKIVADGKDAGPLAGVPLAVKDNIDLEGVQTTCGTPAIDYTPEQAAPVVTRLEAAHGVIIGKTNMHELAFGVTSNNAAFGAVHNPADPQRIPGGSSGGTAAAVAAGIVAGGLGTDTVGSVRVPAALCGIVGFRPTTSRLGTDGVVPSVLAFDVVGPLARSVADAGLLFAVMGGGSALQPRTSMKFRFGVAHPQSDNLSPGVVTAFEAAVRHLQAAGVDMVELNVAPLVAETFEIGYPIGFYEMKSAMTAFLAKHQPQTSLADLVAAIASPDVKAVYESAVIGDGAPSEKAYRDALGRLEGIRRRYLDALEDNKLDAVIYPTTPLEAQPIAGSAETVSLNGEDAPTTATYIRNIALASVCAAPGLSIPIGATREGLPVGLALDGRPGGDEELLAIGLAVKAAVST